MKKLLIIAPLSFLGGIVFCIFGGLDWIYRQIDSKKRKLKTKGNNVKST